MSTEKFAGHPNKRFCKLPGMSKLGDAVRIARERLGISQSELARRTGVTPQTIQALEAGKSRGSKHVVPLARELNLDPASLGADPPTAKPRPSPDFSRVVPIAPAPRDLPVYGSVRGGDGEALDISSTVDWIARPASLVGVRDARAAYVVGDSMEPRFSQGEIVQLHPRRPPSRESDVVVVFTDGTGILKEYVGRSGADHVLKQYNPAGELRVPAAKVAGIYLVTGLATRDA